MNHPPLTPGLYDALLDHTLQEILTANPELRAVIEKIDSAEQPARYVSFVAKLLERALRCEADPEKRLALCNCIIDVLAANAGMDHLHRHKLVAAGKSLLLEVTPPHYGRPGIPRPQTSIVESSLFTGSPMEPQLVHELFEEMRSADEVGYPDLIHQMVRSAIAYAGIR